MTSLNLQFAWQNRHGVCRGPPGLLPLPSWAVPPCAFHRRARPSGASGCQVPLWFFQTRQSIAMGLGSSHRMCSWLDRSPSWAGFLPVSPPHAPAEAPVPPTPPSVLTPGSASQRSTIENPVLFSYRKDPCMHLGWITRQESCRERLLCLSREG